MRNKGAAKTLLVLMLGICLIFTMSACKSKEEREAEAKAKAELEQAISDAAALDKAIEEIGEVSLESGDAITKARETYDAMSDQAKEKVTKLETLEEAEKTYADMKAKDDHEKKIKKKAKKVDKKIKAIGEVTLDSGTAIEEARAAYDKLSDEAKAKVKKLDTLEAAEATYAELVEEEEARVKAEEEAQAKAEKEAAEKAKKEKKESKKSSSKEDPMSIAQGYVGSDINALIKKIGKPSGRTIEDGCYDGGRDGIFTYSGFTVYAHAKKNSDKFIITAVE